MQKRMVILIVSFLLLFTVFFSGCFEEATKYTSDLPSEKDVQILNHNTSYSGFGTTTVTGTAKNIGNKQISVQLKAKFYDKNNVLIDTSFDYISDIDPGEIFSFEIPCFNCGQSYDHYTIGIGSVW